MLSLTNKNETNSNKVGEEVTVEGLIVLPKAFSKESNARVKVVLA